MQNFEEWLGQNLLDKQQGTLANNMLDRSAKITDGHTHKKELSYLLNAAKKMLQGDVNSLKYLGNSLIAMAKNLQQGQNPNDVDMALNPNARGQ